MIKWENVNRLIVPCHNSGMAQTTMKIVIPEDLKRRFKSACAAQDVTMSDVAVELVEKWLKQQESQRTDER